MTCRREFNSIFQLSRPTQYLAVGLPAVSFPIPEVEVLKLRRIADGVAETIYEIEAALANPRPKAARSEAKKGESWEARLEEIRAHLSAVS